MDADTPDEKSASAAALDPCWCGAASVGIWGPPVVFFMAAAPTAAPAAGALAGPVPALAIWATLALGLGAVLAAICHRWVPRLALRAPALFLALLALTWGSALASGIEDPLRCVGIAGLAVVGMALVPAAEGSFSVGLSRAAFLFLVAWILDGAGAAWGLFMESPPWPPRTAAWLLDASPRAFVMEIAGFDWMRSQTVYEAVGTDRIPPMLRGPYRPAVAAAPLLVLGSIGLCLRLIYGFRRTTAHP